jgi:acetyl esterase/lipase
MSGRGPLVTLATQPRVETLDEQLRRHGGCAAFGSVRSLRTVIERGSLSALFVLALCAAGRAQPPGPDAAAWVADLASRYGVTANVTYLVADNDEAQLDVYAPRHASAAAPVPTVIYFHGGGWMGGDKTMALLRALPYLEMGVAVVNVNFRSAVAPAAVQDCRCALRWVIRNAPTHHFDVNRLVVTGDSSGSHLALTTGMLTPSAGLDGRCDGSEDLKVAAIVNWSGVTDVVDVIEGPHRQAYAMRWFDGIPHAKALARTLSPVQYVRTGMPAVLTIHGDADTIAPYAQAVRFHEALERSRVPNRLVTITGGGHGGFTRDQLIESYRTIREFLKQRSIVP